MTNDNRQSTNQMEQKVRHNFRELNVWKEGMSVCKLIFTITKGFPEIEKFALVSQINRSVVSIPSNIAEGCARKSNKVFVNYLEISLGSAYELETQLIIANELGYVESEVYAVVYEKINKIQRMLYNLIETIEDK